MKLHHNKQPQTIENPILATPESLQRTERMAFTLWSKVKDGNPHMFKGLVAHFDPGQFRAEVRSISQLDGGKIAVYPATDGSEHWIVETTSYTQRGDLRRTGFTSCTTTTYPLSGEQPVAAEIWKGKLLNDGTVTEDTVKDFALGGPVTEVQADNIRLGIQNLLATEQLTAA